MKKIIFCLMIFVFCLFLTVSCAEKQKGGVSDPSDLTEENENSKEISEDASAEETSSAEGSSDEETSSEENNKYTVIKDLGIPSEKRFPDIKNTARNVWDMIVFDNYLYIGQGDYDKNLGPCDVWRMNIKTSEWENSGSVYDEQINRFRVINGKLTIPGTDPKDPWDCGSHYVLENGEWKKYRSIKGGIHVFDMCMYDGKLFASIGALPENSAMAVSDDLGKTFSPVKFFKNSEPLDLTAGITNRAYDLFVINGELYTLFYSSADQNEIYKYSGESFEYYCSWDHKFINTYLYYVPLGEKVSFKDSLFIASGHFYKAEKDPKNIEYVALPNVNRVWDVLVYDDTLYVLCDRIKKSGYDTVVLKSDDGENFSEILSFEKSLPSRSFAFDGKTFWFGLGTLDESTFDSGRIISAGCSE